MKLHDWVKGKNLALTTCYDAWSARIIAESTIDAVLVGDSAAMVMQGHDTTLNIDVDAMAYHTGAVARGLFSTPTKEKKFLIGDMPFLSFRKDVTTAMNCVEKLMQAGAQAVKLEGLRGHEHIVKHIVGSGVPVMGHLGLTPQSVNGLGGWKVQGRDKAVADQLALDAQALQELGCFAVVLECVPSSLATRITQALEIPTIGIGAGPDCDGQVLVFHDLVGLSGSTYKFVRPFADGKTLITNALNSFVSSVQQKKFPALEESFE